MRPSFAALLLSAALPALARAQVEVTPFVGFRFGGSVSTTVQGQSG
jgi:hypothetical protein